MIRLPRSGLQPLVQTIRILLTVMALADYEKTGSIQRAAATGLGSKEAGRGCPCFLQIVCDGRPIVGRAQPLATALQQSRNTICPGSGTHRQPAAGFNRCRVA